MPTYFKIEDGVITQALSGPGIEPPDGFILYEGEGMPLVGSSVVPTPEPVRTPVAKFITDRRNAYPSPEELLDMLWHGMDDDPSKRIEPFYTALLAIKNSALAMPDGNGDYRKVMV